jgi:hypothetical protein
VLDYDFARQAIFELKQELKGRGDATDLFGSERGDALAAIVGNIEQTMFAESLYRTLGSLTPYGSSVIMLSKL